MRVTSELARGLAEALAADSWNGRVNLSILTLTRHEHEYSRQAPKRRVYAYARELSSLIILGPPRWRRTA